MGHRKSRYHSLRPSSNVVGGITVYVRLADHEVSGLPIERSDLTLKSQSEGRLPGLPSGNDRRTRGSRDVLDLLVRATLGTMTIGGITWSKRDNRFQWDKEGGRVQGLGSNTTRT